MQLQFDLIFTSNKRKITQEISILVTAAIWNVGRACQKFLKGITLEALSSIFKRNLSSFLLLIFI
jgi:hypothetical protein